MRDVAVELAKRLDVERFSYQERFGEALNLLLTHDEDKEEIIRRIDSGDLNCSGEIIRGALEMQEKRDAEEGLVD